MTTTPRHYSPAQAWQRRANAAGVILTAMVATCLTGCGTPEHTAPEEDTPAGTITITTSPATETVPVNLADTRDAALRRARSYVSATHMSPVTLYRQLTSYEGFSSDDARYAVQECGADWDDEATEAAASYRQHLGLSDAGIRRQLTSSVEGYTDAQATTALTRLKHGYTPQS